MIIDFIEANTYLYKDKPFLDNLHWCRTYENGNLGFYLEGCRKVEFIYNEFNNMLLFRGSIMYFMQGHNFTYNKATFVEGVEYLAQLLHLNQNELWNMQINIFECGVICEVENKPAEYIKHTRESKGMWVDENPKDKKKGTCRSFNDKYAYRKIYDAGKNIQHKQGLTMKQIIQESGWKPDANYLKWEVHYLKPEMVFNGGIGLTLKDLVNPHWEQAFKTDLYTQYTKLLPMKTLIQPTEKTNYKTSDIFAIELIEAKLNEGATLEEIKKMLYARINASAILDKPDKDARKRQVKQIFDKVQLSEESIWDISNELKKAIYE